MRNATTALLTSTTMTNSRLVPTPAERAAGRFMRAPDHDAGTDGGNDAGAGAGDGAGTDASGAADAGTILGEAAADAGTGDDAAAKPAADAADADKPGDGSPGVPESYELKLTTTNEAGEESNVDLDPALVEAATPLLKEAGLTNEAANKILPLVPKIQERFLQQQNDAFERTRADWAKQSKESAEIGGDKLAETQRLAAKALDHFTGPAVTKDKDGNDVPNSFRQLLNESGLGNHPVMLKTFRDIGAALSEDGTFVRNTTETAAKKSREETLYPEDQPKK